MTTKLVESAEAPHLIPDLLSIAETSAYLRLSAASLGRLRKRGQGPAWIAMTPKTILYRRQTLDDFIASGERNGTEARA